MKMKIVSIFDVKAAAYGTPFFSLNEQTALRSFTMMVNDDETMVNRHPEDYSLYDLGQFDDAVGSLESMTPRVICTAASLVKPPIFERITSVPESAKKFVGNGIEEVC